MLAEVGRLEGEYLRDTIGRQVRPPFRYRIAFLRREVEQFGT